MGDKERRQEPTCPEHTVNGILRPDCSNLIPSSRRPSEGAEFPALPSLGSAPPPHSVPPAFYETVKNTERPHCRPTPGATRGADSSSDTSRRRDETKSPLMPMSNQNANDANNNHETRPIPSPSTSTAFHPSYQRPFQQPPFLPQQYYSVHTPHQDQAYPPYAPQPGPGPGFMGHYMTSQPSMTLPLQPHSQFGYAHSFAHPGIHGQETSPIRVPFTQPPRPHPPQQSRGLPYPHPPGSTAESCVGDRGRKPAPNYTRSSSFTEPSGLPQSSVPVSPTSAPHASHHTYSPMHYSPASTSPQYSGYPLHSFAHSSPTVFSFGPPPMAFYGRQPTSPEEVPGAGGWWFPPPGNRQQFDSSTYPRGYPASRYQPPMQMGHPELYAQAPPAPGSELHPPSQSVRSPPGTVSAREHPPRPASPVPARGQSEASRQERSPHGTGVSPSPSPASRKAYHPNPPQNRSEWVMWVGNVPSDATQDELWRFFNQAAPLHASLLGASGASSTRRIRVDEEGELWGGVASVFLIARSNCAFVNFVTEQHLLKAVGHFNGKPIRPRDPRCPRLVCRVRKKDDDLKAGVGGQRGMGLHTRWVKERELERQREKERSRDKDKDKDRVCDEDGGDDTESNDEGPPSTYLEASTSSDPSPMDDFGLITSSGSRSSDVQRHGSSGNQSFASTNSSFLAVNFPKRYFILKSLTQHDLNLSAERGVWATQPHNEGVLDRAYRTSMDVYLIFGVNKSGEFFGYAKMIGPVFHSERVEHVSWASRSSGQGSAAGSRAGPEAIQEEDESDRLFLSPNKHRILAESPAPASPGESTRLKQVLRIDSTFSSPAPSSESHRSHKHGSYPQPPQRTEESREERRNFLAFDGSAKVTSESSALPPAAVADKGVPGMALPWKTTSGERHRQQSARTVNAQGSIPGVKTSAATSPSEEDERQGDDHPAEDNAEGWGREFKIKWLSTQRLPFHRTRHLRNPWNNDREVKVSRDGTELEPAIGQQLLDEWDKSPAEVGASPPISPVPRGRGPRVPRTAGAAALTLSVSSQARRSSGAMGRGRTRGAE